MWSRLSTGARLVVLVYGTLAVVALVLGLILLYVWIWR